MREVGTCRHRSGCGQLRPFEKKRVFDIDMEHCPHCGGAWKIIAAIEEPGVIRKILTHLGLATRATAVQDRHRRVSLGSVTGQAQENRLLPTPRVYHHA
jgi:Zn-finger nucleic acid-binding protein